jgi:hypothetical protein
MAYFKVLAAQSCRETEENHQRAQHGMSPVGIQICYLRMLVKPVNVMPTNSISASI